MISFSFTFFCFCPNYFPPIMLFMLLPPSKSQQAFLQNHRLRLNKLLPILHMLFTTAFIRFRLEHDELGKHHLLFYLLNSQHCHSQKSLSVQRIDCALVRNTVLSVLRKNLNQTMSVPQAIIFRI